MTYGNSGAVIKRSLTDLVRGGCRVQSVAHDPPVVTFVAADGSRAALRADGVLFLLEGQHGSMRFHSLDAALAAAVARPQAVAS